MRGTYHLYVIELEPLRDEHAKWYVGMTNDINRRVRQHQNGNGAVWTSRNEVVDYHIVASASWEIIVDEEHRLTKAMMNEFGADTTRGGGYTSPAPRRIPPEFKEAGIDGAIAQNLAGTGHPDLERMEKWGIVDCEVTYTARHNNIDEAAEWMDELPDGAELRITAPGGRDETYVLDDGGLRDP